MIHWETWTERERRLARQGVEKTVRNMKHKHQLKKASLNTAKSGAARLSLPAAAPEF